MFAACMVASIVSGVSAQLTLSGIFSNHMVIQCEQPVPIWGTADAGAEITVEFFGQKKKTVADSSNHWKIILDPMPASSEPRKMEVYSLPATGHLSFSDVLVGEVWLCSGQSNMEFALRRTENANVAIAGADCPLIRLYRTPHAALTAPQENCRAQWTICTPETVSNFSAVAFFFGCRLQQDLQVPIGLLQSTWSGTRIEPWIPADGFKSEVNLMDIYQQTRHMQELTGDYKKDRQIPSALYNGMIHPHIPFAIRGIIWYQGESNYTEGMLYVDKSRALLNSWRRLWGTDFPFYIVQIAPYRYDKDDPEILPLFWEAQSAIVKTIPNTGMAVISDAATPDDIHPPNKEVPGIRLALLAEANTYGMDVVSTGPVFQTLEKRGDRLIVTFSSAAGLSTRDFKAPDWFEIAGADKTFFTAQAEIKDGTVVVWNNKVLAPVAIRFGWHQEAEPNLMNREGLPASPFRTDDW